MVLLKTINDTDTQPVTLGDYLYIKGRIGWKGLKKSEYLPISNYRIINGESLTLSGIDWNKAGYISAERYEESPEIMLSIGDILLSKDGTIGKIGYVDKLDAPTSVASGIFICLFFFWAFHDIYSRNALHHFCYFLFELRILNRRYLDQKNIFLQDLMS